MHSSWNHGSTYKLKLGLFLLLSSALLMSGCKDTPSPHSAAAPAAAAPVTDASQPVSFWVATDTHYLAKSLEDGGQAFQSYVRSGDGKMLPYSDELTEALVYEAGQKKPDFLILSGDLTNNGEAASHKELTAKLHRMEAAGTRVYVVPGNHDINNPWARSFGGDKQLVAPHINAEDFLRLYEDFGYNEALARDTDSLSYVVKAAPGLWLLMIDSAQYAHNEEYNFPQTDGRLLPSTLTWINENVKLAAKEHASIITVMHHNLLSHTSMAVSGFKLNNSQQTLKAFRQEGLNLVLSGHIHMQDIRRDPEGTADPAAPVYDIATSAMAVNPHQYGSMTFDPRSRTVTYNTAAVDVEGWARVSGKSDPNLLNFKRYAEETFAVNSYEKAMSRLQDSPFTEAEKQSMAETMSSLNLKYFAGTAADSLDEIRAMPGFKLWERMEGGFMSGYIRSMTEHSGQSNVSLKMVLTTQ
ncbi:metallophosphoesterase [Paenibacillus piscarius]|uniref:metallophosphoesterase n=1 Tax=Paenibacillus piscarius TaxID=1089681 RepID=UPI001EE78EBD|nr:metallophosphoesterase [Paenibacillus piscarius]